MSRITLHRAAVIQHRPAMAPQVQMRWHLSAVPADAPPPRRGETPWHPGHLMPVQPGVYRRLTVAGSTMFSFFTGGEWLWNHVSPTGAVRARLPSLVQTLPWCGLTEPPACGYGPAPQADEVAA